MPQVKKNEETVRNELKNRQRLTLPAKDVIWSYHHTFGDYFQSMIFVMENGCGYVLTFKYCQMF